MSRWWIETRDDEVGCTTNSNCISNLPAQKIKHHDLASTEGNKAEQSIVGDRNSFGWGIGMNDTTRLFGQCCANEHGGQDIKQIVLLIWHVDLTCERVVIHWAKYSASE